jgi:hypothetical protein
MSDNSDNRAARAHLTAAMDLIRQGYCINANAADPGGKACGVSTPGLAPGP